MKRRFGIVCMMTLPVIVSAQTFRLASLPATAHAGESLELCAANIGTGALSVRLEFINVRNGAVVAEKTVKLPALGSGAPAAPCVATTAETIAASAQSAAEPAPPNAPARSAFTATPVMAGDADADQQLVVGVALVHKPLFSFREAQVTASIQVLAPDANGRMRTIQTIPLSRTTHPSDGAPVYVPPSDGGGGHHK